MGLFRANNIVANFWMLFATLSAYGVVTSMVGPGVDREALAHVAGEQISWESAIVVSWLFTTKLKEIFRLGFVFALIASLSLA